MTKRCPRCSAVLELAAFGRDRSKPLGVTSWCRGCRNAAARKPGGYGPRPAADPATGRKRCTGCGRVLPPAAFPYLARRGRRAACCTGCRNASRRAAQPSRAAA
jgi:hypothetical protein